MPPLRHKPIVGGKRDRNTKRALTKNIALVCSAAVVLSSAFATGMCSYREHATVECKLAPSIASSFADSVSTDTPSFAVNSSRKRPRMRARLFSNASRYK